MITDCFDVVPLDVKAIRDKRIIGIGMKLYVVKTDDSEEKFFSSLKKAKKFGDNVMTVSLDIDGLPHEGCTRTDLEWWSDDLDSWLTD